MTATKPILSLDCGTTSVRAILYERDQRIAISQREFAQHFPKPAWVEHDANEIWEALLACMREAVSKSGRNAADIAAIGITNQRETVVVWDRVTGEPLHRAIV